MIDLILPSGVYHCEIPDASGTSQNIYVGIYPEGDGEISTFTQQCVNIIVIISGSLSITSLLSDRNLTTPTCTSTGGPPTTVVWKNIGVPVDLSLYEQNQRLINTVDATYNVPE